MPVKQAMTLDTEVLLALQPEELNLLRARRRTVCFSAIRWLWVRKHRRITRRVSVAYK